MHPASRILIYLLAALVIPGLPFFMLALLLFIAFALFLMQRQHPFKLIWRTRWLLLVLILGYGYSFPGEPAWPLLRAWSPSQEGLGQGLQQALHLLALLLWLDLLVLRMDASHLLAGLYLMLRPLRPLGLDAGRAALRLGLTLRAIEGLERGRGNLKRLLAEDMAPELPERIVLHRHPVSAWDVVIPGALLAGAVGLWLSA